MATPLSQRGRRRGFAVLFALAILALLSVFALSFANLTRLESMAATNVRLQVQAAALAEAGVGQACAEARTAARQRPWVEGSDWWANGSLYPVLTPCSRCNVQPKLPPLPAVPAPAPYAPASSCASCAFCFNCETLNKPIPASLQCSSCSTAVVATPLDPRGLVLGTNAYGGRDQVQIRSWDVGSKLDVNLRTPGFAKALGRLGLTTAQVNALIAARNTRGGIRSRDELRDILTHGVYLTVKDHLTVYSTPRVHSTASMSGNLPWSYAVPSESFSPVNVNAASQQVLTAIIADLEGSPIELLPDGAANWLVTAFQGQRGRATSGNSITISLATAEKVAAEIVACRRRLDGAGVLGRAYSSLPFGGPFRTWQQFELFLQNLGSTLTPGESALLSAALHPESRTMGYNPDATRRHPGGMFDRVSVTSFTTRLSFHGAGILEVEATGWITDSRGVAIAVSELDRVVRVFTPMTWGTQAELEAIWNAPAGSPERRLYQSMPELRPNWGGATNDPLDGHLRLTTEHQNPGGNSLYSTAFRAPDPSGPYDLTIRTVDTALRDKGMIAPDGLVTWRVDRQADQSRMATSDVCPHQLSQSGSFELWVKFFGDLSIGTDEALVTLTIDESQRWDATLRNLLAQAIQPIGGFVQPQTLGSTIKLERFKGRLRVTWYYWGTGTGAISPFVLTLSEVQQDISAWKPGEWHHVMVSWNNSLQDWLATIAGNPLTRANFPNDGVRLWCDGSEAGSVDIFKYDALTRQATNSVKYNLGKSISTPMTEGIILGGYNHNTQGVLVHSTGTPNGNFVLQRYSNTTIDDIYVSDDPYGLANAAVPRSRVNRHETNPPAAPATAQYPNGIPNGVPATFDLPLGTYARVGAVGVEVELTPSSRAKLTAGGGQSISSAPAAPVPLFLAAQHTQAAITPAGVLPLSVTLGGDGLTTPVIESVTVLVLPPLQVIEESRDLP